MALTAEVDMESLVCPVCLDLPSGEVHQCFEGHCFCASCWNRFDPHRCPSCRDWLPNKNRHFFGIMTRKKTAAQPPSAAPQARPIAAQSTAEGGRAGAAP